MIRICPLDFHYRYELQSAGSRGRGLRLRSRAEAQLTWSGNHDLWVTVFEGGSVSPASDVLGSPAEVGDVRIHYCAEGLELSVVRTSRRQQKGCGAPGDPRAPAFARGAGRGSLILHAQLFFDEDPGTDLAW